MGLPFAHERRFVRSRLACCDPLCCERRGTALWRVSWGARWNAHSRHQLDNHVHGVFPLSRPRETPTRYRVILYAPASLLYHVHVSPPLYIQLYMPHTAYGAAWRACIMAPHIS